MRGRLLPEVFCFGGWLEAVLTPRRRGVSNAYSWRRANAASRGSGGRMKLLRGRLAGVFLCSVAAFSPGCAAVAKDAGFAVVQQAVASRVTQRVQWNRHGPGAGRVSGAVRQLLSHTLTAGTAVQVALLNNRNLQATYEDLGIAQADLVSAGLLRNPIVSLERRLPGQAAEFDVAQDFVDALLIPLRKRVAGAAFAAAQLRIEDAIMNLVAEVRAAFYELQGAQQMLAFRREVAESSRASAELAQRIRNAGNLTALALRTEQELAQQARLEVSVSEEMVMERRERLNQLLGLWGDQTTWTVAAQLPPQPVLKIGLQGLEEKAIASRFDLAAARQDIVTAGRRLGLTNVSRFIPGGSVGFHYEHEIAPDSSLGPSLGWILPIFDWGQGAMRRDRALLRRSQERYAALAVTIRSEVRTAYARVRMARQRIEIYRYSALPLQAEILRQAQLQYNAMTVGPLQLLEVQRMAINAKRNYVQAQTDYWVAHVALERALGGRLGQGGGAVKGEQAAGSAATGEERRRQ